MKCNLSKVPQQDSKYKPVPKGVYTIRLEKFILKTTASKKQKYLCLFSIDSAGGKKVQDDFFLTFSAMWKIKQFAEALQLPGVNEDRDIEIEDIFISAIGKPVKAQLDVNCYLSNGHDCIENIVKLYRPIQ